MFCFENHGVPKEQLILMEKCKYLKSYLKLQTMDTSKLIQLYYQDMVSIQSLLKSSEHGTIYCRAYYHLKDETVVVEVFKCKNLEPMDANGLSDPVNAFAFVFICYMYELNLYFLQIVC